jgi:hypothetical protein
VTVNKSVPPPPHGHGRHGAASGWIILHGCWWLLLGALSDPYDCSTPCSSQRTVWRCCAAAAAGYELAGGGGRGRLGRGGESHSQRRLRPRRRPASRPAPHPASAARFPRCTTPVLPAPLPGPMLAGTSSSSPPPNPHEHARRHPRWMRSGDAPACLLCKAKFNKNTTRKHHCRRCGYAVCDACSAHEVELARWLEAEKPHELRERRSVRVLSPFPQPPRRG